MSQARETTSNQNIHSPLEAESHAERINNLVNSQEAKIDRATGLYLFKDMTLGIRFEDKCAEMYYRGKMFGFVHLYNGQEAVSSGVIGHLPFTLKILSTVKF